MASVMTPREAAERLLAIIENDSGRLTRIDNYLHGQHDDPYMPNTADAEYKLLARRSVTNITGLLVGTPAQACYVDGFRRGYGKPGEARTDGNAPQWKWWQRSGMDAKQMAVYRSALAYGHSFTLAEKAADGDVIIKGLSPLKTAAIYDDPASDIDPEWALTISLYPDTQSGSAGLARLWNEVLEFEATFDDEGKVTVREIGAHGATGCPVTRHAVCIDLEGRTTGVIEPIIPLQDRINQSVFDLLVMQTFNSFEVRYATGMAPPMQRDPETGQVLVDDAGNPRPVVMDHNARRFLFAEDPDVKFGNLPGGALDGLILSIQMSFQQLAAIAQVPPHHLLGQIANLSADALTAAETSLLRKVEEFKKMFGEAWERVFRICASLDGETAATDDYKGEVLWRDMDDHALAVTTDALGKLALTLDVPPEGLWPRVPGVTQNELDTWRDLKEARDKALALGKARMGAVAQRPDPYAATPRPDTGPSGGQQATYPDVSSAANRSVGRALSGR